MGMAQPLRYMPCAAGVEDYITQFFEHHPLQSGKQQAVSILVTAGRPLCLSVSSCSSSECHPSVADPARGYGISVEMSLEDCGGGVHPPRLKMCLHGEPTGMSLDLCSGLSR
jgi:hypothetical protein